MTQLSIPENPIRVLVFTPTPTHPPIQGNRQRVFDICRAMQSMGADITLLHYATEGLDAYDAQRMRDAWGKLDVVFPRGFTPKHSLVRYPAIDDWFDDSIGDAARRLNAERRFDVCVTNYVWYSKVFESLPADVVRVIDTHDVFGGRAERFTEIGLAPQWYHTSVQEESTGLDRADHVLAIQNIEAETLRRRTEAGVHTVGILSAPNFIPPRRRAAAERLRVGYIGSANPFNVSSVMTLYRELQSSPSAGAGFEIHLAGPICAALPASCHAFVMHGVIESVPEFYRSLDVVVNPMLGGTGLKIKSLEALSFGKPLVATVDAMAGIATDHECHRLSDVGQVVRKLHALSQAPHHLAREAEASRRVFEAYRSEQLQAFTGFWSEIETEAGSRRASSSFPGRMRA